MPPEILQLEKLWLLTADGQPIAPRLRWSRMLIENGLADAVDFFHLDALSSAVRLKVDFDVTLTEVASGLYRMLGRQLAGYESAKSRQLFRHFLNTPAEVEMVLSPSPLANIIAAVWISRSLGITQQYPSFA